jgi:hypothetical protein
MNEEQIKKILSLYSNNIKIIETETNKTIKVMVPILSSIERERLIKKIHQNLSLVFKIFNFQIKTKRLKSSAPLSLFFKLNNKNYIISVSPEGVGSSESIGLRVVDMVKLGKMVSYNYGGSEETFYEFSNPKTLLNSIKEYLLNKQNVSGPVFSSIENLFFNIENKKRVNAFNWIGDVSVSEKNELAKHLGELLPGIYAFFPNTHSYVFVGKKSVFKNIEKVLIPTSSSFNEIDSILISQDISYPISSKSGVGSKASFFSNLLPYMMNKKRINSTILRKLVDIAKSMETGLEKSAKRIVYEYGIRHILKIPKRIIHDSYKPYIDALKGIPIEKSPELELVVKKIRMIDKSEAAKKYLTKEYNYAYLTLFFTKRIAKELNDDPKVLSIITSLLNSKNFFQINLNLTKWRRGEVEMRVTVPGKTKVVFEGGKSAYSDIRASQGLINYMISTK